MSLAAAPAAASASTHATARPQPGARLSPATGAATVVKWAPPALLPIIAPIVHRRPALEPDGDTSAAWPLRP
jgi:hypothetical protein